MSSKTYFYGLGRRKSSTARARLFANGKGNVTINDQPALEYFDGYEKLAWEINEPFRATSKVNDFDVTIKISGGGMHGQVGACQLAIANALAAMNDDLRSTLKKEGLLKRDHREKERKKPGLKRARKSEQFSKR